MALTAAERETTITMSDADNVWMIHTSQRKMVTQLLKNPQAVILDDSTFEGTRMLVAEVPSNSITVRKASRKAGVKRTIKGEACGGKKSDGSPCGMYAVKGTGYCRHHQN